MAEIDASDRSLRPVKRPRPNTKYDHHLGIFDGANQPYDPERVVLSDISLEY